MKAPSFDKQTADRRSPARRSLTGHGVVCSASLVDRLPWSSWPVPWIAAGRDSRTNRARLWPDLALGRARGRVQVGWLTNGNPWFGLAPQPVFILIGPRCWPQFFWGGAQCGPRFLIGAASLLLHSRTTKPDFRSTTFMTFPAEHQAYILHWVPEGI